MSPTRSHGAARSEINVRLAVGRLACEAEVILNQKPRIERRDDDHS